jgi:hypothetical protein
MPNRSGRSLIKLWIFLEATKVGPDLFFARTLVFGLYGSLRVFVCRSFALIRHVGPTAGLNIQIDRFSFRRLSIIISAHATVTFLKFTKEH